MRILCLHGGRQTAEIFENQLSKLTVALTDIATMDFIDAPFLLPRMNADDDVETRSWCSTDGGYSKSDALIDAEIAKHSYDILLGFSQGATLICRYLMRQQKRTASNSPVKGVILAGVPDPRESFADTPLLSTYMGAKGFDAALFFGATPSLHIVGKKDTIVNIEGSIQFAEACGSSAELLLHDHAHSFPQLQSVISSVREFCESTVADPSEYISLQSARDDELDLIAAMYGEEYVSHRGHPKGTRVMLPLLTDVQGSDAEIISALERLRLSFNIPRRYPAVLPVVDVVGGPSWHHVAYEKWRANLVVSCTEYMLENVGLGGAMLMPCFMYANEQALEEMDLLRGVFADGPDGNQHNAASDEAVVLLDAWALEDDERREEYIESAEAEGIRLLRTDATGAQRQKVGDEDAAAPDTQSTSSSKQGGNGGSWTLTIGLIGKPSAGKSTFFNAVTDPEDDNDAARVAAFPFTTIKPNVGTGFGPVECPCEMAKQWQSSCPTTVPAPCDATHGHVVVNKVPYRRHPILVKDVAGLVKGAYQGKGKGNQFLNDLCDADVLVHVVDGAGATDADGSSCPPGQGTTLDDIAWVRAEVHNWIYDNVRAKWDVIRRIPTKLRVMFTGYRSSPTFVDTVLRHVGISDELSLTARVRAWGPSDLHLFVALYIRMRFPMVVALNKSDLPTAAAMTEALLQKYPDETFVPMSAQTECNLLYLRRKGAIAYDMGVDSYEVLASKEGGAPLSKADASKMNQIRDFFDYLSSSTCRSTTCGAVTLQSTGVQEVVRVALASCAAVFVFPVTALQTSISSLRHCFSFKPGTTAEDVFWAMTYAKLLDGKLVRFEAMDVHAMEKGVVTLRKVDALPFRTMLVRVLSNKRQMTAAATT